MLKYLYILDGVPNAINPEEIKQHLLEVEGVKNIHHIHIWGISTNKNALTAHIVVDNPENLPQIMSFLKEELKEHNIIRSTLECELVQENCTETSL